MTIVALGPEPLLNYIWLIGSISRSKITNASKLTAHILSSVLW